MKIRQLLVLSLLVVLAQASRAEVPERTIDEIKAEALARAQRGAYPLGGLDPEDVAEALSLINTRVPTADLELLMRSGDVPKKAWINPSGGHLGREARGWTDPVVFSKVVVPWELRLIEQSRR